MLHALRAPTELLLLRTPRRINCILKFDDRAIDEERAELIAAQTHNDAKPAVQRVIVSLLFRLGHEGLALLYRFVQDYREILILNYFRFLQSTQEARYLQNSPAH